MLISVISCMKTDSIFNVSIYNFGQYPTPYPAPVTAATFILMIMIMLIVMIITANSRYNGMTCSQRCYGLKEVAVIMNL